MTDFELIKAAMKELGESATISQIVQWAEAKKKLDAIAGGEDPAEPSSDDPPPAQASAEKPDDVVAASQEPTVTPVAAADPATQAAGTDLANLVVQLAEASGMDEASLLALIQEHVSELGAYLKQMAAGAPSGTAADAPAAMSRKLSVAENTVERLRKEVDVLKASAAARDKKEAEAAEAAKQAEAEAAVDALIAAAKALDSERDDLIWLYRQDAKRFETIAAARGQVAPTTKQIVDKPPASTPAADAALRSSADYRAYEKSLARVIPNAEARHAVIVERINQLSARG